MGGDIWTIPAQSSFLDCLAAGLFDRYGCDPLAVSDMLLVLPTRRACRALREAYLRHSGGVPLLLPRMVALVDFDDDEIDLAAPADLVGTIDLPPAIPPLQRQFLLAQLVLKWGESQSRVILPGQALALGAELARLIDQIHTEGADLDRLDDLVPEELAEHWGITVKFLAILRNSWPELLAASCMIDPADRRNRLIAAQIALWQRNAPAAPVVAAGFDNAIPAVGDLLEAVLGLALGNVVLAGLDCDADDDLWAAIRLDPAHPQHGLANLLARLDIPRESVEPWTSTTGSGRDTLSREVMRPAEVTDQWRGLTVLDAAQFDGLTRLDLATPHEEAGTIALVLRAQLERPGATAMLVTPDRGLARRVAAALRRWDIDINDSAGTPLNQTAPGAMLRLLNEAAAEALAPVPLLALLKHPLAGGAAGHFRERVRRLEITCLRGPRPAPGLGGLMRVAAADAECLALVKDLARTLGPFLALVDAGSVTLAEMVAAHVAAAETLAGEAPEGNPLWAHESGEAMAAFIAELLEASPNFPVIKGADYPALFEAALAGRVVRPRWGTHPRLQILGTLEARLQSADLVVLAGLNEGTWPATPDHDPWMSRQMRQRFGLPAQDAAIGISAHDFAQGFGAREVVLTRAARSEGNPTVPSRWLLRLETVLRALGLERLPEGREGFEAFPTYFAMSEQPAEISPIAAPRPCPPVKDRPRQLSVTEIETWMRDPYAIYARHILRLKALDPLDQDPGVAERGTFIHNALDGFVRDHPGPLGVDALDQLEQAGLAAFGDALSRPGVWAFWWPRFRRIARWFVETERARRPGIAASGTELRGRIAFDGAGGIFTLTAKADRIDRFKSGGLALIDYKTGGVASKAEIRLGFAAQLPLEAAMAASGGFAGVPAAPVLDLEFWKLSGGEPPGEVIRLEDPAALTEEAVAGILRLIAAFDRPETPYLVRPTPEFAPRYSDYAHLARVLEWGADLAE